jgi:4-alpha-glucanotransferase
MVIARVRSSSIAEGKETFFTSLRSIARSTRSFISRTGTAGLGSTGPRVPFAGTPKRARGSRQEHARLIEYYKYIQFVLEEQLNETQRYAREQGMPIGLYHDLAVATDSCGSDLWAHREFYVQGCRVGAPPDDFSPNGQDWAFPPPNFQTLGRRLPAISRKHPEGGSLGGALRIDHVMRLFRLFWIPEGFSAAEGIYVRDNALDLMRILALESVQKRRTSSSARISAPSRTRYATRSPSSPF